MGKVEGSKLFFSVYNCRLCGCIMSSNDSVRRHEQVCRLPEDLIRNKCQQMNLVKFPCPLVTLTRIPPSLQAFSNSNPGRRQGQDIKSSSSLPSFPSRHHLQSSLRALAVNLMSKSLSRSLPENSSNSSDDEYNPDPENVDEDEEEEWPGRAKTKRKCVRVTKNRNQRNDFLGKISSESEAEDNITDEDDDEYDDHVPAKKKNIRLIKTKAWGKTIHKKVTVNEETHKHLCPVKQCGARLKHLYQLKLHFITHLENNPFACPVPNCIIRCDNTHHFRQHIDWHLGRNILTCEKCKRTFSNPTKLRRHACKPKRHCKPSFRRITMSLEEMTKILEHHYALLESKGLLLDEDKTQDKLDDDILGLQKFHQRIDISGIISNDPIFRQISKDNPKFKDILRTSVKNHNRNHVKEFQCSKCDKSYQNAKKMRDHYNFMHRKRPYECKLCGQSFLKEIDLDTHQKQYHDSTGNKIYMRQLKNGTFQCTKCKFESKSKERYQMRRHWLRVHNVTLPNPVGKKKKAGKMGKVNMKKQSKISPENSPTLNEDLPLPVTKIESEPALELAMIISEDVKPINGLKIDQEDSQHPNPSENFVKREFKVDICLPKMEIST